MGHWGNIFLNPLYQSHGENIYILQDEYSADLAAGAVNGTVANGTGTIAQRTRTVIDAENKISIASNLLNVAPRSSPTVGNPGLWYGAFTRQAGLAVYQYTTLSSTANSCWLGWDNNQTGQFTGGHSFWFVGGGAISFDRNGTLIAVGTFNTANYISVMALRATGSFLFVKGGLYPDWALLWVSDFGNNTPLYPGTANFNQIYTLEYTRVPIALWLPSPLVSDGFGGVVGASDGLGHAEGIAGGLGAGGSGIAWTDRLGTWQNAAGVRSASALDVGGSAICTGTALADVLHSAKITRSGGNAGVIVRYASATNYVYAYHDGTNVTLRKVVNGSDSQVLAPTAATYAAGARLLIVCDDTEFRTFYNNAAVGAKQTISDATLQTGTGVGLYTTDTGNTFDDLQTWGRHTNEL